MINKSKHFLETLRFNKMYKQETAYSGALYIIIYIIEYGLRISDL